MSCHVVLVDDGLYDFDVYAHYKRDMQRDTIAVLVGSQELAEKYVEETGDVYLVRGHFSPKADFQFTSWQASDRKRYDYDSR